MGMLQKQRQQSWIHWSTVLILQKGDSYQKNVGEYVFILGTYPMSSTGLAWSNTLKFTKDAACFLNPTLFHLLDEWSL